MHVITFNLDIYVIKTHVQPLTNPRVSTLSEYNELEMIPSTIFSNIKVAFTKK